MENVFPVAGLVARVRPCVRVCFIIFILYFSFLFAAGFSLQFLFNGIEKVTELFAHRDTFAVCVC